MKQDAWSKSRGARVMEQDSGKKEGIALRGFLRVTFLSLKSPQTHLQSTNSPWNRAGVTLVLVGVVEQDDKKGS